MQREKGWEYIVESIEFKFPLNFSEDNVSWLHNEKTVETCCLLERLRNAKDHVTFTPDMEDYYRIKDAEADKEKR